MVLRTWAETYGMTGGEFALLDVCIQAMDAEYIRVWTARQPPPPSAPAG